jgi:hypothetical protein
MSTASTPPTLPSTLWDKFLKYGPTAGVAAAIGALISLPISNSFLKSEKDLLTTQNTTLKQDVVSLTSKIDKLNGDLKTSGEDNANLRGQIEKLGALAAAPRNPGDERKAVQAAKDYFSYIRDEDWKKAYNKTNQEYQTAVFKGSPDNLRAEWKGSQPEIKNIASY